MTDDPSDQISGEQQVRRAREVLLGLRLAVRRLRQRRGKVLMSQPEERDQREEAYRRARVATEMKAGLECLIETYEADARLKERREQASGGRRRG